jgi:hypothetical protein
MRIQTARSVTKWLKAYIRRALQLGKLTNRSYKAEETFATRSLMLRSWDCANLSKIIDLTNAPSWTLHMSLPNLAMC